MWKNNGLQGFCGTGKGTDQGLSEEHTRKWKISQWYGTQAKEAPITTMNWEDVESHICSMVENGTYMSASEAFLVDTLEVKQENFIT